jgi:hypothetical protein
MESLLDAQPEEVSMPIVSMSRLNYHSVAMQRNDLSTAYQIKTDEELLQLAEDSEQLTPEAHFALKKELAKRRIEGPVHSVVEERNNQNKTKLRETSETVLSSNSVSTIEFIAEVFRLYHGHFWLFVRFIAPAVVTGYVLLILDRNEGLEIARHAFRGLGSVGYTTTIVELWVLRLTEKAITWMAFCISFAAICSAVSQIATGVSPSAANCLSAIRWRGNSFVRLCLLLFFLVIAAVAVAGAAFTWVWWFLRQHQVHLSWLTIQVSSLAPAMLLLLVVSRFGLAIPAVILDNCKVGQAMFRSDELTQGKWGILAILLAKSMIGAYIAGMVPYWLAPWVWNFVQVPSWLLTMASIAGVVVVEPYMFIGFALLYTKLSPESTTPSDLVVRQLA